MEFGLTVEGSIGGILIEETFWVCSESSLSSDGGPVMCSRRRLRNNSVDREKGRRLCENYEVAEQVQRNRTMSISEECLGKNG